jgi:purine-binding chemotaxis protein CheW
MSFNDREENQDKSHELTQFLSFSLGKEEYGVDILRVQEIRGWEEVRELPKSPDYIKGVLNLRDQVVPIIDLRVRFGLDQVEYKPTTVIVVLSVFRDGKSHVVGAVVDAVSDVLDVDRDELRAAPDLGTTVDTRYINGMFMLDTRMLILLNVDKLLDPNELASISKLAG